MLPKGPYNPKQAEEEMLNFWLDNKFYKPEYVSTKKLSTAYEKTRGGDTRKTYTNILPPPNANGNLHLGHMSGYAYQDLMGRFQRMLGKKVLLYPGKDHAGIQTEVVFENELAKKGKSKRDLGRETFYKACYKFCMDNAATARKQEMNLGLSADFDRELFTLDPKIVEQVLQTFIDMYQDELIYRDKRLINWCVRCQSALADIDTEYKEAEGTFTYFKYAFPEPDKYALELKKKFENKEVEVTIERVKGQKIIVDKNSSLTGVGREYEWEFDYYGYIKGEINPNDNEDLDAILIGFEDGLKPDTKVKGKAQGIMMRFDGDFKVYVVKEGTPEEEVNKVLKEHFMRFSKHFGGVQNRIFTIHTKPEHYTQGIVVGTVRPETVFGDTGIAVHPDDERYKEFVGKELELIGPQGKTKLKIVATKKVEKDFGTGALKATPAHAIEDWEIAMEHKDLFPEKQCINFDGKLNHLCGKYEGMTVKEAREAMLPDMEASGILVLKEENYVNRIQICERCKSQIEPLVSYQWFLDTRPLKTKAKELVEQGFTEIMPEGKQNVYLDWMNNPEDWCITRQLWWGYRVPVWYKQQPTEYITQSGEVLEKIGDKVMHSREDYKEFMQVRINPPGQDIWVVRHGESEGNVKELISGQNDHQLTAHGREQAAAFSSAKKGEIDLVITSNLDRAKETGSIIAKKLGVSEIIETDLIQERDFGDIEGLTWKEIDAKYPEVTAAWKDPIPNGETIAQMEERADKFIQMVRKKYSDRKILVVSHGGMIRVLLRKIGGMSLEESWNAEVPNCKAIKMTIPESEIADKSGWVQDEDVLDTWFSSGQWPTITLGANPEDFKTFYPTQVMETGWDILIFWVTRMMLLCPYKAEKLYKSFALSSSGSTRGSKLDSPIQSENDSLLTPFKHVHLHGLVLDKNGVKMSKSKGNGIDPFEMMQKYGTDALRMSFIFGNKVGQNYRLYEEKIETFRNFCNKLWNISKFVLMNLEDSGFEFSKNTEYKKAVTAEDEVMINKVDLLRKKITRNMENFQFGIAVQDLYESSWHDFADGYIEQIKPRIYTKDKEGNEINTSTEAVRSRMATMYTLWYCLTNYLKMLHPFIPFITDRIWKEVPKDEQESETLMYTKW
jgi:valyl-tRNA synthetase